MKIKTRVKAGTIDEDGFIQEPERWNDEVSKAAGAYVPGGTVVSAALAGGG